MKRGYEVVLCIGMMFVMCLIWLLGFYRLLELIVKWVK